MRLAHLPLRPLLAFALLSSAACRGGGYASVYEVPRRSVEEPTPAAPSSPTREVFQCTCSASVEDKDGDCERDTLEDTNANGIYDAGDFSDLERQDTDGDGIMDGCEDRNHDGVVGEYPPESDPRRSDTDGDGLADGLEDENANGYTDFGETNPCKSDSDDDGVPDGVEDRNRNGRWDCGEASAPTMPPCETDPRERDSDHDGLGDTTELKTWYDTAQPTSDFLSGATATPDCRGPNGFRGVRADNAKDDQTCPWSADSDGDGIIDGFEDANGDGFVSSNESDPRRFDTDGDGLGDGLEDTNKDGFWDGIHETNPTILDTDHDGLADGVEDSGGCLTTVSGGISSCNPQAATAFVPCDCAAWHNGQRDPQESDPKLFDTDGDGLKDGTEDASGDGVCQKPSATSLPRASDESCAFQRDSDGDNLADGTEDPNGNGQIDRGETDPRRGDPDNDCLLDSYELLVGTDPFVNDTDGDGLADGLESAERLRFDGERCVPITCSGMRYASASCPDPLTRDSDGDGAPDGSELLLGVRTGEDENADGCVDAGETNPCAHDAAAPPALGSDACLAPDCSAGVDLRGCASADCLNARKRAQALVCSEGNVRPIHVLANEENDYALALPALAGPIGAAPTPLFDVERLKLGGVAVGDAFQSIDALSASAAEPIRGVHGAVLRMGTLRSIGACSVVIDNPPLLDSILPPEPSGACPQTRNVLVANVSSSPSDVADRTAKRILARLGALGYTIERTSGGTALAHDDETRTKSDGTSVQTATDVFTLERQGATVDAGEIARVTIGAVLGGANLSRSHPIVAAVSGVTAELRVQYYRRVVSRREILADGKQALSRISEYGAVLAVAPLAQRCGGSSGAERLACKKGLEQSTLPIADLTNGSALSRFQARTAHACDGYAPAKSKADFLLGIDDSGSMQEFILAIQSAVRDVAFKLQANAGNLDWRIAMTTSAMGQGDDAGPRPDLPPLALDDAFVPGSDGSGTATGYPPLAPDAGAPPNAFFAYQTTAFTAGGVPQRCIYADAFDPNDPRKSPYCCDLAAASDADFVSRCCSMAQATELPAAYGSRFTLADSDSVRFGAVFDPRVNDTLRCYDIPRFGQDPAQAWSYIPYYATADANTSAALIDADSAIISRHFNDSLCGPWQLAKNANGSYGFSSAAPPRLWGARGHLWPQGFVGPSANPRLDGANLLVRNADMLVVQMNRQCYRHQSDASIALPSPRALQDSGAEELLQAVKRAIQRATKNGRANGDALSLRPDAPLISLLVSDEEDFALKVHDGGAARPYRPFLAERDRNALPAAECDNNGDAGCTVAYCQDVCFADLVDAGDPALRIPSARRYSAANKTIVRDAEAGAYCIAPASAAEAVAADCSQGGDFCASSSARFDGFAFAAAGENADDDALLANAGAAANSRSRDVLNASHASPGSCAAACGTDCMPCMRFLREKQFTDFFGGSCSPPGGGAPDPSDIRRYPRPTLATASGERVLPMGLTYAISRRPGQPGGTPGACGSSYAGGDGRGLRDVALATGGKAADLCAASTTSGFADFLDTIIVDAQGIGSPFRLSGSPISSTLRVGVLGKDGRFRMIRRSNVAGFDYNSTSRSIAFFSESQADLYNVVSADRDDKVFVSYVLWDRPCGEDCPLGDACTICTCSAASPQCCTPEPTFVCQSPTPCPQGCNPCEQCDPQSNTCKAVDVCSSSGCGADACTTNGCASCADGTRVTMPCDASRGGVCPEHPLEVCVSRAGIANPDGAVCFVSGQAQPAQDCCGSEKSCDAGEVCVLKPCLGSGCLPTAECRAPSDANYPLQEWCGDCALGSTCAPVPCPNESCRPVFRCVADNPGASASCERAASCGCPGGVCPDCPVGYFCGDDRQCQALCAGDVSVSACCEDPSLRVRQLLCCPLGEVFDARSESCVPGLACEGGCPSDSFCDVSSGRCIRKGG